ncbi:MAG: type II CRISPR-associated endonuclease Cas1, partial [Armatimonadia bacterium]|nr:type II CRISPR-associated endonuclease Cas1 [Armatimonadia bacterium]
MRAGAASKTGGARTSPAYGPLDPNPTHPLSRSGYPRSGRLRWSGMIKRTIEISSQPSHLAVRHDQLEIRQGEEVSATVPIEDIGVLIVDQRATTYTHPMLTSLIAAGGVVVVCDERHLPSGLLLPIAGHHATAQRLRAQVQASKPLNKRLWQQLVRHKIEGQALNLGRGHRLHGRLRSLIREVRSGDPANVEAQAARLYWQAYFGTAFRRDQDGEPPNNLLNYGYTVIRAAIARALCGAGLHPSLGLHHANR